MPEPDEQERENAPEEPIFYSAGFRPRRKRNRLLWLIAGGSVLFVVLVVVLVVTLTGGGGVDTSTPQGLARTAVNDYNNKDFDGAAQLQCVKTEVSDTSGMRTVMQSDLTVTLGEVEVNGSRASAVMHVDASLQGRHVTADALISMQQLGGYWCISSVRRR